MAEEPDDGRDPAGERPSRADWDDLRSAVRPAEDDGASEDTTGAESDTDGSDGNDASPRAVRDAATADTSGDRVDWGGLRSAVEPAADHDNGGDPDEWEWETQDRMPPDLAGGESPATNPQLLADDDHQSDGPTAHEPAEGPVPADRDNEDSDTVGPVPADDEDSDTVGPVPAAHDIAAESEDSDVITADSAPEPTDTGGLGMEAPETDEEAPLGEHVEEMVKRLAIVIAIAGLASVIVFPVTEGLITTIWNQVLPSGEAIDPRVYHPLELLITQLKVASLAGLVVALPAFVYESYAFMRPGLYENERRYYIASIPTSLVLAVLGVLFAFFIVLPYTMDYFVGYTKPSADIAFALGTTFNLILMVMGYLAVVFQIPLFIMLAIMLGVVTRRWLESRRLLFWAAFAGISFTFGAIDPTGVVPIIVAITMIALFEGTLALLRWTGN